MPPAADFPDSVFVLSWAMHIGTLWATAQSSPAGGGATMAR